MTCLKILLALLLILPGILSTTCAQNNPVYKIMISRGWIPYTGNDKNELLEHAHNEFPVCMGYNESTLLNLKKIGVNVWNLRAAPIPLNIKVYTAISDCIIIGTVIRKIYPLKEHDWFHTIAYVRVDEYIRNDYNIPKGEIPVLIQSGPISPDLYSGIVGEDTLSTGEHVLLFLDANGLIRLAKNNNLKNLYEQLINDPIIKFEVLDKYDLINEKFAKRKFNVYLDSTEVFNKIDSVLSIIPARR